MEPISVVVIVAVIFAGAITSVLPCTYPMILGFFSLLVGDSNTGKTAHALKVVLQFFLGFSVTYAIFGSVAGLFGQFSKTTLLFNGIKPTLIIVGGILFILIGFLLLNAIPLPDKLKAIKTMRLPKNLPVHAWWTPVLVGGIFAAGWSPCIGPILGGVLVLAGTSGSVLTGALLLVLFSIGLMAPLIILVVLYTQAFQKLAFVEKVSPYARIFSGILFIILGALFITDGGFFLGSYGPPAFLEKYI